ncbi:MAG: MBOAT family protein [Clostridia bacterium]|nr:MBOAT family protein [Clostridia bacterium]
MLFSSLEFIFLFLPLSVAVYFLVPLRKRNLALLLLSLAFYGFGEPLYLFLMVFTIAADHIFGALIERYRDNKRRAKVILSLAIIFNLGILFYFKYFASLLGLVARMTGLNVSISTPALPIGISFYTFQAMSYVIDVYRRDVRAEKSLVVTGAYVTLFPQLIAGPIIKYKDISDQLKSRAHSLSMAASGIQRFSVGLIKKCVLANSAGELWSRFSGDLSAGAEISTLGAWLGVISFAFQIYFDFSGYSDMAIGLGRIFGFEFPENFNYPYISKSITEFWRRWHITLSTYFREYVYIPLGGNRCARTRMYLNLLAVWSLTGLWHGASFNFLFWGLYYFLLISLEKAFLLRLLDRAPALLSGAYALFFILLGWLIFAADGTSIALPEALTCVRVMLGFSGAPLVNDRAIYELSRNALLFIIMAIASTPIIKNLFDRLKVGRPSLSSGISLALSLTSLFLSTAYLVNSGYNPFLYFRF